MTDFLIFSINLSPSLNIGSATVTTAVGASVRYGSLMLSPTLDSSTSNAAAASHQHHFYQQQEQQQQQQKQQKQQQPPPEQRRRRRLRQEREEEGGEVDAAVAAALPTIFRHGQRTAAFVELVDIFPTLAEVAGLTLAPPLLMAAAGATAEATGAGSLNGHEEPPLDGLSLLPLLLASAKDANGGAPARCAKSIGRGVAVAVQEKRRLERGRRI